jgi:hypothetical protein
MAQNEDRLSLPQRRVGETARTDFWWLQPLLVFLGLSAFIVYSTWAAFQGAHYSFGGYLSPFYSPEIFGDSPHAWFGTRPPLWPEWLPYTPALLILWAPGGFRFTCYYYRGAYYKSFWASPLNCTVGKPLKGYRGEKSIPLVLQNIHRYFLYLALVFIVLLSIDVYHALWFTNAEGQHEFGLGVGTLVLLINVILLGGYTMGCHSLRHLIGGKKDCVSTAVGGSLPYKCVSCLNKRHMRFAWFSLFWVGFTDFYVRMCSMGVFTDLRIF